MSCGVKAKNILNECSPDRIGEKFRTEKLKTLALTPDGIDIDTVNELICVNDEEGYGFVERKKKIKQLFRQMGVAVSFYSGKMRRAKV